MLKTLSTSTVSGDVRGSGDVKQIPHGSAQAPVVAGPDTAPAALRQGNERQGNAAARVEPLVPAATTALLPEEERELAEYEAKIELVLVLMDDAGQALMWIREKRLYRAQYATFEDYCRGRWNKTARRIQQITDESELKRTLGRLVENVNPGSLRPLLSLPEAERAEAFAEAQRTAPGGRITRRHMEQFVKCLRQDRGLEESPPANGSKCEPAGSHSKPSGPGIDPLPDHLPPATKQFLTELRGIRNGHSRVTDGAHGVTRPTQPPTSAPLPIVPQPQLTREDLRLAAVERAIAADRELMALLGTPDSEAAANQGQALEIHLALKEQLLKARALQAARPTAEPDAVVMRARMQTLHAAKP